MKQNSLAFGTSGIRGLVTAFTPEECYSFTAAFIDSIRSRGFQKILIAGDLRESTPSIIEMVVKALHRLGFEVVNGGMVPTPALAWGCATYQLPGVMVTGSHIPADRNGLKFYLPEGEILKSDEEAILKNYARIKEESGFEKHPRYDSGMIKTIDLGALFKDRYLNSKLGTDLSGLKIGFYAHSSVARDLYPEIFRKFGAEVFEFARSAQFIPVDTEAVESVHFLASTLKENKLDLVVSTDGDADRPLVITDQGAVVPGEILGLITSKILGIDSIVYPVSCSSALQASGWMKECMITRIGSPFVLGRMLEKIATDRSAKVAGFEANGGYLLGAEVAGLKPLMTRDSLLPILSLLFMMKKEKSSASALLKPFSAYVNRSGLIKNFPKENSEKVLSIFKAKLADGGHFGCPVELGGVMVVNELDGIRAQFKNGSTVHLRPSGNAPEFRLYIESNSVENADLVLGFFENWVKSQVRNS